MQRLEIGDLILIGEEALGVPAEELLRVIDIPLAESALWAPFAGFDDIVLYPDPITKAAILCSRLIRNHPLPDGNKRLGYAAMVVALDQAGFRFSAGDEEEADAVIRDLASRALSEDAFAVWVQQRTAPA